MKYILAVIALYPLYLGLIFVIDMRIERLRPYIQKNAVELGSRSAVREWEIKRTESETLIEKKRKMRDEALKAYSQKLTQIMEVD